MNPLRTLGGSNCSRCGAVRIWRQKCRSEVSIGSRSKVYRSEVSTEVLLGSVDQKCCSEVSITSVEQKCCSEVAQGYRSLLRGVAQKCRAGASLMSLRYVCRNVARIVAQAAVLLIVCGSDVSLKGVFRVSLRSAALAHEVQVSSSSWKIVTLKGLAREVRVSSSGWKIATLLYKSSTCRFLALAGKSRLCS